MSKFILTIVRGCPGSGKSFMAKALSAQTGGIICSTDDFFINEKGVYEFDVSRLYANHCANQRKAEKLMQERTPHVIIDNTNITKKEMEPYLSSAAKHGYSVQVVRVEAPVEVCIARNQHNVPPDTIRKMAQRLAAQPAVFEGKLP